jgi:hypothetical protein
MLIVEEAGPGEGDGALGVPVFELPPQAAAITAINRLHQTRDVPGIGPPVERSRKGASQFRRVFERTEG